MEIGVPAWSGRRIPTSLPFPGTLSGISMRFWNSKVRKVYLGGMPRASQSNIGITTISVKKEG